MHLKPAVKTILLRGLFIIALGLVAFLSLRSSPSLFEYPWLPRDFARWVDTHPNSRTGILYFFLAVFIPLLVTRSGQKVFLKRLGIYTALLFDFLVVTELAQWPMPRRSADINDVFWGVLGIALGVGIGLVPVLLRRRCKSPSENQ